nr:hypothetical protein BaRGS_028748 [Batillaria attramentaria]
MGPYMKVAKASESGPTVSPKHEAGKKVCEAGCTVIVAVAMNGLGGVVAGSMCSPACEVAANKVCESYCEVCGTCPANTFAAITVRQSEARFVCEEYHAPLMSIPTLLVAAELHSGTAMTWRKGQTDDSFP